MTLNRRDFVPKEREAEYLRRDSAGLPDLRLIDAGDRLGVRSPMGGGGWINPRGPGLRSIGLFGSYVRGTAYNEAAFKAAHIRKGTWVDLTRAADNPHDPNAIRVCRSGSGRKIGYIQRGRAAGIAKRMDAGEVMAGVCLRSAFLIVGSLPDLRHLTR